MDSPDIIAVLNAFFTLIGRNTEFILRLPVIRDTVRAENAELFRAAAGAFMGSSSAGIIYLYVREKFYLVPLYFRRHHTIVCGLNYRSLLLVRNLANSKQQPVVIEKDSHNPFIDSCRMAGVIVIVGEPADPHLLKRAGAGRARYILSLTDSDETNAEVALQTMNLVPSDTRQTTAAIVQILDPGLYLMIRKHAFTTRPRSGFRIEFLNQYDTESKILFAQHPPLCNDDTRSMPLPVIIIGAGRLGETVATRVARWWLEKNLSSKSLPDLYIVDAQAEKIIENLSCQYPLMPKTCNLVPVSLDVRSAAFRNAQFLEEAGLSRGFTAYICFKDDTLGLYTALTLHQHARGRKIKIIVRIEHNPHVARLVSDTRNTLCDKQEIIPVDMYSLTSDVSIIQAGELEYIAQAIHKNYCKMEFNKGHTTATNKLLVSWEELGLLTVKKDGIDGKKFQDSNRNQARLIRDKLMMIGCDIGPLTDWDAPRTFTFTADELETLAAVEHERWMQEKMSTGWTYGPVRDDGNKIHPSILPFDQLSESEKEKDRNTIRDIPRVLSLIDFQVYRRPGS